MEAEIHKDTDKMATYMDVKEGSWFDIALWGFAVR